MKLDKPSFPSMLAAAPPPPAAAAAPEVDDDEGPMVWYHEGPPELTTARYWIADYSISKYSVAARVSLILIMFSFLVSEPRLDYRKLERKHRNLDQRRQLEFKICTRS